MSVVLQTGVMYYRENQSDDWHPLILKADVDLPSFIEEYSQKTWELGEYCRNHNVIYRCTTAITVPEVWNSAHWQETTIGDELKALNDEIIISEGDIGEIKNTLNLLVNKKILFIGDSFATGSGGGYSVTPWPNLVASYLGLSSTDWWNFSRGGSSFGYNNGLESNPETGSNFADRLRKAVNTLTDAEKNSITDIVIGGAINDWSHTDGDIKTGITTFCTLATASFPNAQITFCSICGCLIFEYKHNYFRYSIESILQGCGAHGIKFKNCGIGMLAHAEYYQPDGIHPNQNGENKIAQQVAIALINGDPNFSVGEAEMTGTNKIAFTCWCDGCNYHFSPLPTQVSLSSETTIDSTWRKIYEYDATIFTGYRNVSGYNWTFYLPCAIKESSGWTNGVNLAFEFRQSASDFTKCEFWVRQIGYFSGSSFKSFSATSILPSAVTNSCPIWAI